MSNKITMFQFVKKQV